DPRDPLRRLDHLSHRKAVPVTAVHLSVLLTFTEVIKGPQMRPGKVVNVDVVSDARAVRRRIVGPEDRELLEFPPCRLERPGNEVCGFLVCLPYSPLGVRPRDVEVPQRHILEIP